MLSGAAFEGDKLEVEDEEDVGVEGGSNSCGAWLEDVDSVDDGDCVDVVESGGDSWLEDVDSEDDSDCVDVV